MATSVLGGYRDITVWLTQRRYGQRYSRRGHGTPAFAMHGTAKRVRRGALCVATKDLPFVFTRRICSNGI